MDEVSHHALKGRWCNRWQHDTMDTRCLRKAKHTHEVGRRLMKRMIKVWDDMDLWPLQSHDWWEEVLPAAWGGGGAGCRMAPRSSSPPRELESDAQTASPARALTPGETRHSHTAPYTLREKTQCYTPHCCIHSEKEGMAHIHMASQHFRTPNTRLNQRDKWTPSHRIPHSNPTQFLNS